MIRSYPGNTLVAYPSKGKVSAFAVPASQQVYLFNARAFNNSGGAINVGLMRKFAPAGYRLLQYTAVGTVYTNASALINAGTAVNLFTTTDNDGFLIQSHDPFGMLGITVSAASAGATLAYSYWTGSAFATLTTLEVPSYSSTGDKWVVFQPPSDWVKGGPAATGVDQNAWTIFVQGTTHPTTAVAATAIWLAQFLEYYVAVPNNAAVQLSFPDSKPYVFNGGESLIPYFSTANAANQVGAYYAIA